MIELLSIPAIIAATEAVKMAGLPSRFAAVFAIAVGSLFGFLAADVVGGLLLGLASSGSYSAVKAILSK